MLNPDKYLEHQDTLDILNFYEVLKEFLEIYANEFIGNNTSINLENVAQYLNSNKYLARFKINSYTKDEIFKILEEDIVNGFPIWQLLNVSDWTKNILELEFASTVNKELEDNKNKYKCLTCKYYEEKHTSFGTILKCNVPKSRYDRIFDRGTLESWKKKCKDYVKGDD